MSAISSIQNKHFNITAAKYALSQSLLTQTVACLATALFSRSVFIPQSRTTALVATIFSAIHFVHRAEAQDKIDKNTATDEDKRIATKARVLQHSCSALILGDFAANLLGLRHLPAMAFATTFSTVAIGIAFRNTPQE